MHQPVLSTYKILRDKALNKPIDESWVAWAREMMEEGYESINLHELAGIMRPYNQFVLAELTDAVLKDLNLNYSNQSVVIRNYAYSIIKEVVNDRNLYYSALGELKDLHNETGMDKEYEDFFVLYEAMDDLRAEGVQWYFDGEDDTALNKRAKRRFERFIEEWELQNGVPSDAGSVSHDNEKEFPIVAGVKRINSATQTDLPPPLLEYRYSKVWSTLLTTGCVVLTLGPFVGNIPASVHDINCFFAIWLVVFSVMTLYVIVACTLPALRNDVIIRVNKDGIWQRGFKTPVPWANIELLELTEFNGDDGISYAIGILLKNANDPKAKNYEQTFKNKNVHITISLSMLRGSSRDIFNEVNEYFGHIKALPQT